MIRQRLHALAILLAVAIVATGARGQTAPARMAGASLRHSAVSLLHRPEAPGRAGRIYALIRAAGAIDKSSPETCRILADIHAVRSQPVQAAKALATCVRGGSRDIQLGRRWLSLELAGLQRAETRAQLLEQLIKDNSLPGELRAEAAVQLGKIRLGQAEPTLAAAMYQRALRADPGNPSALAAMLATNVGIGNDTRAATVIRLHNALPGNETLAVRAADALGAVGLYDRAVTMLDYVGDLREKLGITEAARSFLSARCNALLDAGHARDVVKLLEPHIEKTGGYDDIYLPLIEAYQRLGKPDQAKPLIDAMETHLKQQLEDQPLTGELAIQLGWFYAVIKPDSKQAETFAEAAEKLQPDNPLARRIRGVSLLQAGRSEQAVKLLNPLVGSDPWAAAFLADHYHQAGQGDLARQTLNNAGLATRSGPAARQLRTVAKAIQVELPTPPGAQAAREAFQAGQQLRIWTLTPQMALSVQLQAVDDEVAPGEPMELIVKLTNLTGQPLPLGADGVARPVVALEAVTGAGRTFNRLPTAILPAPRLLAATSSIQTRLRVDVGELDRALRQVPLSRGVVTFSGTFDPQTDKNGKTVSLSPGLQVAPAAIVRAGLVVPPQADTPAAWKRSYDQAIDRIDSASRSKTLARRLLAARQVASLLALSRNVELGKAEMPDMLKGLSVKPDAMDLYKRLLLDRSPVVRAEMLAAVQAAALGNDMLKPMGPRFDDPSWLVRLRAAETIGQSRTTGRKTILEYLSADKVSYVRDMARAFGS